MLKSNQHEMKRTAVLPFHTHKISVQGGPVEISLDSITNAANASRRIPPIKQEEMAKQIRKGLTNTRTPRSDLVHSITELMFNNSNFTLIKRSLAPRVSTAEGGSFHLSFQ